ncbi:hypothetical protein ASE27_06510 [Oerskovia sp. Root918]|uniref:hypothetical protein n=1 Tax=unclassified Oerskovia TaxID=2619021 RepID=UPI0006FD3570|nr:MULTISPECIES: hypothetical protein [unclassified Oerskovia]KRC37281.1 hypothetical protein ASE15_03670 [Oerskovia sp. Root22]KRD40516.1 hypothetical protein ASE27_06510 [Oerskovia sp. Root918]
MRGRRDEDHDRYGPGADGPDDPWPAYPAGTPGPSDPLSATRDADLTGPAAPPPGTRPADAAPHRPPDAPPSGVAALVRDPDPAARTAFRPTTDGDEPPAGFWRTARWMLVLGGVVGAAYLGTCSARGLTLDDAAVFLPVGIGGMALGVSTVATVVAWVVRYATTRRRTDAVPVPGALRGWTRAYGLLLGFMVAAFVWGGAQG